MLHSFEVGTDQHFFVEPFEAANNSNAQMVCLVVQYKDHFIDCVLDVKKGDYMPELAGFQLGEHQHVVYEEVQQVSRSFQDSAAALHLMNMFKDTVFDNFIAHFVHDFFQAFQKLIYPDLLT